MIKSSKVFWTRKNDFNDFKKINTIKDINEALKNIEDIEKNMGNERVMYSDKMFFKYYKLFSWVKQLLNFIEKCGELPKDFYILIKKSSSPTKSLLTNKPYRRVNNSNSTEQLGEASNNCQPSSSDDEDTVLLKIQTNGLYTNNEQPNYENTSLLNAQQTINSINSSKQPNEENKCCPNSCIIL